jgi:hypothetical protein
MMEMKMTIILPDNWKKITVRKGANKAHRAFLLPNGTVFFSCRCPNTQNGQLDHGLKIVCQGWDQATCKK